MKREDGGCKKKKSDCQGASEQLSPLLKQAAARAATSPKTAAGGCKEDETVVSPRYDAANVHRVSPERRGCVACPLPRQTMQGGGRHQKWTPAGKTPL